MLELKDICVSFRSERQDKLFEPPGTRCCLTYLCRWKREAAWGS